jgi:hypothetical protein
MARPFTPEDASQAQTRSPSAKTTLEKRAQMKVSHIGRYAVGIGAAILILAGCGGSQPQVGAPATMQQSAATGGYPNRGSSRMAHRATSGSAFTVSGRFVLLNGTKFYVKGMVYSPTPIGNGVSDPPALNDPLRDGNSVIWQRDLPLMRAMGVNVIHIYNVVPPPYDKDTGPISKWLDAAWNGGTNPIYVLLTVYFDGSALNNDNSTRDLAEQYYELDKKYGAEPAVMGVVISNEIIKPDWWDSAKWWGNFNRIVTRARAGFAAAGNPNKIVTTSNDDAIIKEGGRDRLADIYYGERHGAKIDVWGDNPYRGRTFTGLFSQIRLDTTKPVFLTEYGAPASYHPDWANTYFYPRDLHGVGYCVPTRPSGPVNRDAAELPKSGDPGMDGALDLVTNNAKLLHDAYSNDGVVSGGFYFEWTDEWWKANADVPEYRSKHVGDPIFTGHFPGCAYDHAWFGLNAISLTPRKKYFDTLKPRPTLDALKAEWAKEQ